jgi:hypothetical protein
MKANFDGFLSLVYNYLSDSPDAVQAAFNLVLNRKALSVSALAAQNEALYSGRYPHLTGKFQELRDISNQLVHLTFSPPVAGDLKEYQQNLAKFKAQENDLQKFLASQVAEIKLQQQVFDCKTLALELEAGSCLVELVCFNVFNFSAVPAREEKRWEPRRYLAFVLPGGQPEALEMIDLGAALDIDIWVQIFRWFASDLSDPDLSILKDLTPLTPFPSREGRNQSLSPIKLLSMWSEESPDEPQTLSDYKFQQCLSSLLIKIPKSQKLNLSRNSDNSKIALRIYSTFRRC